MGQMAKMFGMGAGAAPPSQADLEDMAKKMGIDPNAAPGTMPNVDLDKLKNLGAGSGQNTGLPGLGSKPPSGLFGGLPGLPGAKPFDPTKK